MEMIRLEEVSLWRRTQEEFSYDLKRTILSFLEGKYRHPAKRLILDKVNLTVSAGEKLGIIGENGAGKSTLLKIISGILEPTTGKVRVRGKVAPLIELGAGFDPDLSVVDNIILYGVFLGFTRRKMMVQVPEILEFAELENYRFAPLKSLSSGMTGRLGFSIATNVKPEILILDEILSVGDEHFKAKCAQKMDELWAGNTTVLFVSHDLAMVQKSCNKAIWLDRGSIIYAGNVEKAIIQYRENIATRY